MKALVQGVPASHGFRGATFLIKRTFGEEVLMGFFVCFFRKTLSYKFKIKQTILTILAVGLIIHMI